MAVPFFKVSVHVLTDARYRAAGAAARGVYLDGLAYCATHRTDGFLPQAAVTESRWADRLVKVGLWAPTADGWLVLDYLTTHGNLPKAKIEQRLAQHAAHMATVRSTPPPDPCEHSVSTHTLHVEARSKKLETRSQNDGRTSDDAAVLAHLQRVLKAGV